MPSDSGQQKPKKPRESFEERKAWAALGNTRLGKDVSTTILIDDGSSTTTSVSDSSECNDKTCGTRNVAGRPCRRVSTVRPDAILTDNIHKKSTTTNGQNYDSTHLHPQQAEDMAKFGKSPEVHYQKPGGLEIFCGCARMTKELQAAGFDAVGIDYSRNKDKPETKAYVELDLTKTWGMQEVMRLVKSKNVKITFMAPPCGSASAARLIRRKVGPDPKPLRSKEHPDGLPKLNLADRQRVSSANKLYQAAAEIALMCEKNGICWVIENPTNSLMWETSYFKELIAKLKAMGSQPRWTHMQMCMHGGSRDKKTSLLYGGDVSLDELSIMCDKSHTHKPWGYTKTPGTLWATAEERNYPRTFCKRIAKIFAKALIKPKKARLHSEIATDRAEEQVRAGKQPRRNFNDLIPEFSNVVNFKGATQKQMDDVKREDLPFPLSCGDASIPYCGKVLHSEPEDGGDGSKHRGTIGIFWTKEEFTELAKKATHPLDQPAKVPKRIARVIYDWARLGPERIKEQRKSTLKYYQDRAKALEEEEKKLKSQLNPEVREVIYDKKILLFKEMLQDIGYDDPTVVRLLTLGVRVVGLCDNTGIWENSEEKLPKTTARHLWASAPEAQRDVQEVRRSEDELSKEIWKMTMGPEGEVAEGLLKGPLTEDELVSQVGKRWVPARRFGLQQGEKIRPVDDFSQYGINRAFGSQQKVAILGIDHVVAWSRALIQSEKERWVSIADSQGAAWETWLHPSWSSTQWRDLKGRVADLKNAYKQVAVAPEHKAFNVIAIYDPTERKTKLFRALALMFGQTAAVYAFLRISRALAALGSNLLSLFLVEYFDDFTQVESEAMGDSAQESLEGLLDLLGWKVAMTESKRKKAEKSFVSLGVKVGFEDSADNIVTLSPKEGRLKGIIELANKVLERGTMGFKEALAIKGKLQFAEGQLFYRVAVTICRLLSRWASVGGIRPLTDEMRYALRAIEPALSVAGPRLIEPSSSRRPTLIWTDGACEPDGTTVGGILIKDGMRPQAFGARLTKEAAECLAAKPGQKQVIGQAELLPILVAKTIWSEFIKNEKVIHFVDNDSARLAMIKGYSPVITSLRIITACSHRDAWCRTSSWYARVPTKSNIADEPSRMRQANLIKMGAEIVRPFVNDNYKWFEEVLQ